MISRVSASAGSGKTYSLTRRFLALLRNAAPAASLPGCVLEHDNSVYSLAEILAATFTNKAAAEMKSRVLGALKEEALEERRARGASASAPLSAKSAEQWVERILRNYSRLNIRTIDSLLAALVRLSAIPLQLSPDFELSFDAEAYFTPLYDALMDDLRGTQPLPEPHATASPFLYTDGAALRAALLEACNTLLLNDKFTGFSPKNRLRAQVLPLVERLLREETVPVTDVRAIHARIRRLHADVLERAAALLALLEKEELKAHASFVKFLRRCPDLRPYAKLPQCTYVYYADLDAVLNKSAKGTASASAMQAFLSLQEAAAAFSAALPLLLSALQFAPLSLLAHEIYARMRAPGAENAPLPAIRLPVLAQQALAGEHGVSDALCRMGSRLSRLLLDEFQDTSREQWAAILPLVVESLATGGGLTYVGDVKQAIYSWRGGDARLFEEAVHEPELTAIAPNPRLENLPYNWRSHPAVVAHNNAFFSLLADPAVATGTLAAMLPEGTPQTWLERAARESVQMFSACEQDIPPEKGWDSDPLSALAGVTVYEVEAERTNVLETLVHDRMRALFLEELMPRWSPGDVAVLVRSGEEGALAARWLTDWGLPVVTENSFLMASHPLVTRLIAFLAFLDYPPDDLAFWEFISGPECFGRASGLRSTTLEKWLAVSRRAKDAKRLPLYHRFRQDFPEEWQRLVAPFHSQAGIMGAYDMLVEIIKQYDLFSLAPEHGPFLRRLLELAHLAEGRGHSSLSAFLQFWEENKETEHLPLPDSMDAVRIMTIHKAKGLEFPVVVLPFHHRGLRAEGALAAVSLYGTDCLCRVTDALPDLYYPALITQELERLSLLYVAWTRPVYALHAFITRPKQSTPLSRGLDVLLAAYTRKATDGLCRRELLRVPPEGEEGRPVPSPDSLEEESFAQSTEPRPSAEAARHAEEEHQERDAPPPEAGQRHPMDWLPRLKIYRSSLDDTDFSPKRRGTLAHLCLEQLILREPRTDAGMREDVARAVAQALRLFPLPIPLGSRESIAQEMERCVAWFAALPEAPFWLRHGLREQGILDAAGNMHRVDLLVDAGGEYPLTAVDYKTGHALSHEQREAYRNQVRRYMGLLSAARQCPVRGLLLYLDERRVEEVHADEPLLKPGAQPKDAPV